jgi:hypothetical protein
VIAETAEQTNNFTNKVPDHCINKELSVEWFEKFYNLQAERAKLYNTVNDIENIVSVFNKIPNNSREKTIEAEIIKRTNKYIEAIRESHIDHAKKEEQIKEIRKASSKNLADLYKNTIRQNFSQLCTLSYLSTTEKCVVKFLDFTPNVLLVFDDCAAMFKRWIKECPIIKKIFYNGRHYYITLIITAQDDKEIDSELRKNSMVSIFTTHQAATANFDRTANNYPKHEKKRAEVCIKRIFKESMSSNNYKKLVYVQDDSDDQFYYSIADLYDNFKIGSPHLWQINEKIKESSKKNDDKSNNFLNKYIEL